jgi:A/G-specific adenine glycosylase
VGSYTAAAISSFAYNLPYAVLDGNVFRVLSRIFSIEIPIDSTKGKKEFSSLAQALLPKNKAGTYNQAIMDFGAVICKPAPLCGICFFNTHCQAYLEGRQDLLPIKEKTIKVKERWFNYFVLRYKDQVALRQRTGKDIWQQLFEFLLIETAGPCTVHELLVLLKKQYGITVSQPVQMSQSKQKLSHQLIHFNFIDIRLVTKTKIPGMKWTGTADLALFPFPKTLAAFAQANTG